MAELQELTDEAFTHDDNASSVVKPYTLSHGTLAVQDLAATRRFYEEFLGLKTVQHAPIGFVARCGVKFHIVCLQLGEDVEPAHFHNHWGVDVATQAEVDTAHAAAVRLQEEYGIRKITEPLDQHGIYSFYMEDRDHNFWEIQYYPGFVHDDIFDFGDRFTAQGGLVAQQRA